MKALRFIIVSTFFLDSRLRENDKKMADAGLGRFRACCFSKEKQLTVAGAALDLLQQLSIQKIAKRTRFPFNPVPAT